MPHAIFFVMLLVFTVLKHNVDFEGPCHANHRGIAWNRYAYKCGKLPAPVDKLGSNVTGAAIPWEEMKQKCSS